MRALTTWCWGWRWLKGRYRLWRDHRPRADIPCDFAGQWPDACTQAASMNVRWGRDDRQQANACQECSKRMFEWCRPQIAAGICWWSIGPPRAGERCER